MKDILRNKVKPFSDARQKYNALREGLQHLLLKLLDEEGFFSQISFVGGTALRVLYELGRFSEDLDFSLQHPKNPTFDFQRLLSTLVSRLELYNLAIDTKVKQTGAVHGAFIRFKGILQEFDIIRRPGQKLSVKLEVDTNPPAEARYESHFVQKDFLFSVVHHDLPTLCAGKLLAFLHRAYTKGRDVYDVVWFLSRKTPLNRKYFYRGLQQATGKTLAWSIEELRGHLAARIDALALPTVANDVRPFLDNPSETRFFDAPLLKGLLSNVTYDN